MNPQELRALLADAGFSPEDPVDEHGEYCVRGGVVDLFPAGHAYPVRIEFIGDVVESIRRFDPATQRSIETLDRVSVIPLREVYELGLDASPGAVPDSDRTATVFEFAARHGRTTWLVSEYEDVEAQAQAFEEQVRESHREAVRRGQSVPSPDALIVSWPEASSRLRQAVHLDELAIEDSPVEAGADLAPPSSRTRHVATQPVAGFRGRLPDWIADIRRARERGETVVFVAGTSGRADRSVELLRDYGVTASTLDRVRNRASPSWSRPGT